MMGRLASDLEVMDFVHSEGALVILRMGAAACPRRCCRASSRLIMMMYQLPLQACQLFSPPHLAQDVLRDNLVKDPRLQALVSVELQSRQVLRGPACSSGTCCFLA